ncbi:MAG: hypothetical protein JKY92_00750 [Magnetovibrio sp.]|nr:hypothetical protein [Magnetovibrio sp.]
MVSTVGHVGIKGDEKVTGPRIFVNIASYRDPECQWTVKDLFDKAEHPERIFVGICWQCVPIEDDDCFRVETRPKQVRFKKFQAKDSRGVGWARHHSQSLWDGEEFTLQIDSHMRFVAGWDRILLEMYEKCPTKKAVLTTYPIPYTPPNTLSSAAIVTIVPNYFDKLGILMFVSHTSPLEDAPPVPTPTSFCAAGFLFAPSQIIKDVPYDPYVYFHGEEISLAARLWTFGWDLFTPNQHVIYHDYSQHPNRVRHWTDNVDWERLNVISQSRVRHLFGIERSTDPAVIGNLKKFGLGTERSLSQFEAFSGLNFKRSTINGDVKTKPPNGAAIGVKQDREQVFTSIWKNNVWGNLETKSGPGSTRAKTDHIRPQLLDLFAELGIKTLVDAGCGDFNWMGDVATHLDHYRGVDIVASMIDELSQTHKGVHSLSFQQADVVKDILPKANAILVRDVLTHFSQDDVKAALEMFAKSGSTYLIATTHQGGKYQDIRTGDWFPMDLSQAPFKLLEPLNMIREGAAENPKCLGVWRLDELA